MKVINWKYIEIHDVKNCADIKVPHTVRFTDEERESLFNTIKKINQYNENLYFPRILASYAEFLILFKAWYKIYKVKEKGNFIWKVREFTEDSIKYKHPRSLLIPEYNFDNFLEMIDWMEKTLK